MEDRFHEIEAEILELKDKARRSGASAVSADALDFSTEGGFRETLQSAIVWAAVVPKSHVRHTNDRPSASSSVQGYVLFLTSWGTHHTAVIEQRLIKGRTQKDRTTNVLRLLPADDDLGTINNIPEPETFYNALLREQARLRTRGAFRPSIWAPDYKASTDLEIIEDVQIEAQD